MPALLFLLIALLGSPRVARAQEQTAANRKQARATRVANDAIRLDGQLDDAAWAQAAPITDFVQKEPDEGAAPSERTEVRIVYDDSSLYIGARMFSKDPAAIQAPMSRRDNVNEAEFLQVSLDTYLDRRTSYSFAVAASGVRADGYHATDNQFPVDFTYDPVWQARTNVDAQGWTAEFWIPLTQLRFSESPEMVWGMNIRRYTPTLNEDDYWVAIGTTDRGWASRFGELHGFEGVEPRRRVEIYPYVAGASRVSGDRDPANPFDDGKNLEARAGADLNLALGTNLTLEATINPDFGQVEADPAEVNLSTNESLFSERRAFFLEGNSLLQGPTNNYYYSRRIGARPLGPATGDFVEYPDTTTILGAAKVTGRLPSGLSIAGLSAITAEETARTYTRATDTTPEAIGEVRVAPRTTYAVGRVQQEFGAERSTVSTLLTAVRRDLKPGEPLAALLTRSAYSGVADTLLRFGRNAYELDGLFAWSYISGDAAVIERTQRNVIHVLQRPDRVKGSPFDPARTSLGGSKGHVKLSKVTGEHWLWGSQLMFDSPEFDSLDLGRLVLAGDLNEWVNVNYRDTTPGSYLRSFNINTQMGVTVFYDTDLGRKFNYQQNYNFTFLNFWRTAINWSFNGRGQDPVLTRGGPSMEQARAFNFDASLSNSASAQTRWTVKGVFERNEVGGWARQVNGTFSIRPAPAWQVSITPDYRRERSTRQFITQRGGGRPGGVDGTFGVRSLFGHIERSTLLMQIRLGYTFKPDLNLDFYAEPFAASGRYERIGELAVARGREVRFYGEAGLLPDDSLTRLANGDWSVRDNGAEFLVANRDFNVQSFRSNLVLRWEWRPGTTFFLVWQQDREKNTLARTSAGPRSMFGSFTAPGDNFFVVKTTYRFARR